MAYRDDIGLEGTALALAVGGAMEELDAKKAEKTELITKENTTTVSDNIDTDDLNNYLDSKARILAYRQGAPNSPTYYGGAIINIGNEGNESVMLIAGWNGDEIFYRPKLQGIIGATYQVASREWFANQIVNNLTTNDPQKVMSAAQGVVLKTFIDSIMVILNSPDTTLDDLQEIVAYIKQNKTELENLGIPNIAGLEDALSGKASINDSRFHEHANKTILDTITQSNINSWNTAFGWGNHAGLYLKFINTYGGDLDLLPNSITYANGNATHKPTWATTDGAVITIDGASKRQLWFGRLGQIGIRAGTGATSWTDNWIQLATQNWILAQNFAQISQLFSGNYNDLSNKPNLYQNWKLFTNGSQKTSIGSLGKLDLVAGANIHIGYSAGGVVTFSVTGLTINDIANLATALAGKASVNDSRFHTHGNKAILDAITQAAIDNWTNKIGGTGGVLTSGFVKLLSQYSGWMREISEDVDEDYIFQNINLQPNYSPIIRHGIHIDTVGSFDESNNYWFWSKSAGVSPLMTIDFRGYLGVGLLGFLGDYLPPTESIDAAGTARLRDVPNRVGDFARIDANGVVTKRTVSQTKYDLGIGKVIAIGFEPYVLSSADRSLLANNEKKELNIVLPDPAAVKDQEFRAVGNTVNFSGGTVVDLLGDRNIETHEGSITFASDGVVFYKIS